MASITLYTRNILETGTVSVTGDPDTGYPESRLYDRNISLYWKDTVTEAKDFKVDQGASDNLAVDFLAIPKHNFNGVAMQWQYSTDDFVSDINDAVTDWTQGDNEQIIKTMSSALTKRYWRVTLASMSDPKCSEIYMSYGYTFDILHSPHPVADELANVRWNRSVGGIERSTKFGDERRVRVYSMFLSSSDLTNFRAAMDDLDGYSKPFYIKDHEGDYWMCRLQQPPREDFDHKSYTHVTIKVIEML